MHDQRTCFVPAPGGLADACFRPRGKEKRRPEAP
jgi:hypothetical protein